MVGAVTLTALTEGAAAPLIAVAAVKLTKDTANIIEGAQDIYKANRGDLSRSFNFIRDTIFFGNEEAYQFASAVTDITFDIVAGKALKGNITNFAKTNKLAGLLSKAGTMCNKSKFSNFAANIGGDMFTGAIDDFIQTGKINPKNMAASALTGTLKGIGMNKLQLGKGAMKSNLGRKAVNTGIGTGVGMDVDKAASSLRGEEYDPRASFVQNAIQSAAGQAFGEPIDAASGSFLMTAHEFILHVQLPDGYCAAYEMREDGNGNTVYREVNGRYILSRDGTADLWNVRDLPWFVTYCYDGEGLLAAVEDQNGNSLELEYDGGVPVRLTTPLGYTVSFTFREGHLTRMEDGAGRTVEYRYDKGLLTEVVHMDGGISRYAYTADEYLETSTDQ